MSDFHQFGPVTALPRLRDVSVDGLEHAILHYTTRSPVSLVLPMIPEEMGRPALGRILDELCEVPYLDSLVVALNRATNDDYERTRAYFARYPGRLVTLWCEAPAIRGFMDDMVEAGLTLGGEGKGRACWLALGYLLAERRVEYIAFHDADVLDYRREMLARLVLPAVDPTVDYDFVKGYYARFSDRLNGRVTRLLLAPLLTAFTRLLGEQRYIQYLSSFRYALSGEFAVQSDLAMRMRLPSDWGLEIVTLFEVLRHRSASRMCQVELTDRYDHKHRELSPDNSGTGLHRMARDVIKHLLRTLAAAGVILGEGLLRSLLAAYQREAEDAVADSYAVAFMNDLTFDRHQEEQTVQTFVRALRTSIEEFRQDPVGVPLIPNWARVWSGMPDADQRLVEAVGEGAE
jgi:glucosyl-3-phosphoglycerate synthase